MKTNKMMRDLVLEVVDNQLNSGDPPETGATYKRLLNAGIQEQEVKRLIACVVASELFAIQKSHQPFDHDRYVKALNRLPELPWD
jgi:peroxiredoxin family protein